jgi:hypothetical protein
VAVPLPHPVGLLPGDEYKLALSFDGDRFLTPWLTVLGKRAPQVPLIEVDLVRPRTRACRCPLQCAKGARRRRCVRHCSVADARAAWGFARQTHTGGHITAVHAKAQLVPHAYLRLHEELIKARAHGAHCAALHPSAAHALGCVVRRSL